MKRSASIILIAGMVSTSALTGTALAAGRDDLTEIALFQKAQHDIAAGIKAAETASGGKAIKAEFEEKNGTGVWEVKTVAGAKRAEVKIDATTGAVISTKDKGDVSDDDDAVTPEMLGSTLADLETKAETAGGGKVMAIEGDREDGKFRGIEVEIVKADGSVHDFMLNPADGKLDPVRKGHDDDSHEDGENNG